MVDTNFLLHKGSGANLLANRDSFNQLMLRTEKRLRQLIRTTLGAYQLVRRMDGSGVVLVGLQLRLYKRLQNYVVNTREEFFALAARELHWELITLVRNYRAHLGDPRVPVQIPVDEDGNEMTLEFVDVGCTPDDLVRWELFYNAVHALEGESGEVFRLHFFTDCSFAEIGKQLQPKKSEEASARWASRAFNRALIELKRQLGGLFPDGLEPKIEN